MKKNYFFSLAAAALSLSFAACSQDDIASNANVITPDMETSYAKVRISMGSIFGTRADGTFDKNDFDRGTQAEAAVKSLMLVLYDDEDQIVGTGTAGKFEMEEENRETPPAGSISDAYESTIVKFKLNVGSNTPTKLRAYVNTTSTAEKTSDIGNTTTGFVMTNSGYYANDSQNNSWTIATKIGEDNLYDTIEEAQEAKKENVVTINVERLAAKVNVFEDIEESEENTPEKVIIKDPNGTPVTIKFEAKKWAVTGLAKEMFTLKQQYDFTCVSWANDYSKNRSYWAKGVNYETSYTDYTEKTQTPLQYLSLSEIVSPNGVGYALNNGTIYVPEHTIGESAKKNDGKFDGTLTATSLVVVGKYTISDDADNKYKARDGENDHFYLSLNGTEDGKDKYTIYNEEEMIEKLIERAGVKLSSSSTTETTLNKDELLANFKVVTNENSVELKYEAAANKQLYYKTDLGTWVALSQDQVKDASVKAKMYNNGWAYFWGPITHNKYVGETEVGYYGVVRNHSYQITIHSFSGLGAPMDENVGGGDPEEDEPDPSNPIIPDPDDVKDAYINATLNVLSWHNIINGVNF